MTRRNVLRIAPGLIAVMSLLLVTAPSANAGSQWTFETLDGDGGNVGRSTDDVGQFNSVTTQFDGNPHVWYYDAANALLRHAWWNGSFWSFETLDGTAGLLGATNDSVGQYTSVVIFNGEPHVFYYDADVGTLRHGWFSL